MDAAESSWKSCAAYYQGLNQNWSLKFTNNETIRWVSKAYEQESMGKACLLVRSIPRWTWKQRTFPIDAN